MLSEKPLSTMMGRRKDDIAEPEDRHSDWFLKDSDLECLRNETKNFYHPDYTVFVHPSLNPRGIFLWNLRTVALSFVFN